MGYSSSMSLFFSVSGILTNHSYRFIRSASFSTVDEHLLRFYYDLETHVKTPYRLSGLETHTSSGRYQSDVLMLLHSAKDRFPLSDEELRYLQIKIESITLCYDEESIFHSSNNILRMLIRSEEKSAKDLLKESLTSDDGSLDLLISELGHYTLEGLIVYEVGNLFNSLEKTSMIRLATLIDRLETSVRTQASILRSRRLRTILSKENIFQSPKGSPKVYPIGQCLVQFMLERGMITLINQRNDKQVKFQFQSKFTFRNSLYVICNFDLTLLPVRLNLPMIYKPIDWAPIDDSVSPLTISDLSGGYLSAPSGEIYDRYNLLSSRNINHFDIDISPKGGAYQKLCNVMNKLQGQAFQINKDWLEYLQSNWDVLVEQGLLMPRFLHTLNINDISKLLREYHMKNEVLKKAYSYSKIFQIVCKDIQRSRYEDFIFKLASAYAGYNFYLPAFLDFRGRIYRCGILHFHERDLAKSLILFAGLNNDLSDMNEHDQGNLSISTAFHYSKFKTIKEAKDWYLEHIDLIKINPLKYVKEAKHPFQFMANTMGIPMNKINCQIPITQDASASAYQIMSYFMMDETMAMKTNLIPTPDGQIQDVYDHFLEELKKTLQVELDPSLSEIVCKQMTRNLVKGIFMPKIYGKTFKSTADNINEELSHYITPKESIIVAKACLDRKSVV